MYYKKELGLENALMPNALMPNAKCPDVLMIMCKISCGTLSGWSKRNINIVGLENKINIVGLENALNIKIEAFNITFWLLFMSRSQQQHFYHVPSIPDRDVLQERTSTGKCPNA